MVDLASSNTVTTTPASVTVLAGATSASFTIATTAVTAEAYANISGNVSSGWLTTKTLWWRVRANSSSGASSAWSEVRRFELK